MKDIYINSRLHALLLRHGLLRPRRAWVFSAGERWLYLSPTRLAVLARRLGMSDQRLARLVRLVRHHAVNPDAYLDGLGVTTLPVDAEAYCPRCGAAAEHPDRECPACREALAARDGDTLPRCREDQRRDAEKRAWINENDPDAFSQVNAPTRPFPRRPRRRMVVRDWARAGSLIRHGVSYREVARELDCSVGLVHRRIQEHFWENN